MLYYSTAPIPESVKHNFWYPGTQAEIETRKAATEKAAADKAAVEKAAAEKAKQAPKPVQLIPQFASVPQQFYCRELNGSFTLRSTNEIMESLQPGYWSTSSASGYPFWVRTG